MLRMKLSFSVSVLLLLCGSTTSMCVQEPAVAGKQVNLATMQLDNLRIEEQSIETLFTRLSLSYNIPIGLEIASHDDEFVTYALEQRKGTLADLLNQFCDQHHQYSWEIKDGVLNVFPRSAYRDLGLDGLLRVRVSKFSVKENSSAWTAVDSLTNTVEVQEALKTYGMTRSGLNFSGGYFPKLGRQFMLDVDNMTVKTILNKVIEQSPVAKVWIIKRYGSERRFVIRFNARNEEYSTSQ